MKRLKTLLNLFLVMFKIGLFTFGGGYAMIAIIENELVEKKKWFSSDDFYNMLAIAESTPGPIAINSATFIGYKKAGVLGSLFATLGVVLPSFIIIFIISLFFNKFLTITAVANAFKGIQVCVCYLILSAGIKMIKKMQKRPLPIIITSVVGVLLIVFTLFSIKFSSIFFILGGALLGLLTYLFFVIRKKSPDFLKEKESEK